MLIFKSLDFVYRLGHIWGSKAGLATSYLRIVFMSIHDGLCITGRIEKQVLKEK